MKKITMNQIGIFVGFVLWVWAIIEKDEFGVVKAMLLIALMYVIKIESELSKIKKEKDEVSK